MTFDMWIARNVAQACASGARTIGALPGTPRRGTGGRAAILALLLATGLIPMVLMAPSAQATEGGAAVPPGIVSWWAGDGDANDAIGGNHGSFVRTVTFETAQVGQGFRLGNSVVRAPGTYTFSPSNEATFVAWFKLNVHSAYSGIVSSEGCCRYRLLIDPNGRLFYNPGTHTDISVGPAVGTGFHHAAMAIRGGGTARIYLDGRLLSESSAGVPSTLPNVFAMLIGAGESTSHWLLEDGVIDEVAVFSRALSSSEIQAIFSMGIPSTPGCATVLPGIASWWPGDGDATDIAGENDGVLRNGASFATGMVGQAFRFDGIDDYVRVAHSASLDMGTNDFTIELWARGNGFTSSGSILSKQAWFEYGGPGYFISYPWSPQQVFVGVYDTRRHIISTGLGSVFDWAHIALVRSGSSIRAYVNGVDTRQYWFEGTDNVFGSLSNTRDLLIGRNENQGGVFYGLVDEVSIYRRALSVDELRTIVAAGTSGKCKVTNTPPVISAFYASSAVERDPVTFSVVATDADGDPLTYSFDFEDDGLFDVVGGSNAASFVWGDDHAGTARVRVSDGEAIAEATADVIVDNAAPSLIASDGPVKEGIPVVLGYQVADPGSDDLFVRVQWEDGFSEQHDYLLVPGSPDPPESTDVNPRDVSGSFSRTFGDDTMMGATITAADDDGGFAIVTLAIVVVNGEPFVTMADIPDGLEGSPVSFSATATDPGSDPLTFCWNTDDGTTECTTYASDGAFPHTASDGGTHVWGDDATYDVVLTVTDDDGGSTAWTHSVVIGNVAPILSLSLDATTFAEGSPINAVGAFMDPGSDDVFVTWTWEGGPTEIRPFLNDDVTPDLPKSPGGIYPFTGTDSMSHTYPDDGVYVLTVTACDDDGGCSSEARSIVVYNLPPRVSITGPSSGTLVAVGQPLQLTGEFADPGTADTHEARWSFDSSPIVGTVAEIDGSGTVTDTFGFASAGIYFVTLTVLDDDGGQGFASTVGGLTAFIVVYDPEVGFVTGGGWFDSPPGAYVPGPTLTGRASFGFVSKYEKGANTPTGQTEFQFKVADLNFHSASYEWLVVSGARGQYKGSGTINGAGDYGFLLTLVDGQVAGGGGVDKFRMKIWDKATGKVVYDNQAGSSDFDFAAMAIAGGSIIIHRG